MTDSSVLIVLLHALGRPDIGFSFSFFFFDKSATRYGNGKRERESEREKFFFSNITLGSRFRRSEYSRRGLARVAKTESLSGPQVGPYIRATAGCGLAKRPAWSLGNFE